MGRITRTSGKRIAIPRGQMHSRELGKREKAARFVISFARSCTKNDRYVPSERVTVCLSKKLTRLDANKGQAPKDPEASVRVLALSCSSERLPWLARSWCLCFLHIKLRLPMPLLQKYDEDMAVASTCSI